MQIPPPIRKTLISTKIEKTDEIENETLHKLRKTKNLKDENVKLTQKSTVIEKPKFIKEHKVIEKPEVIQRPTVTEAPKVLKNTKVIETSQTITRVSTEPKVIETPKIIQTPIEKKDSKIPTLRKPERIIFQEKSMAIVDEFATPEVPEKVTEKTSTTKKTTTTKETTTPLPVVRFVPAEDSFRNSFIELAELDEFEELEKLAIKSDENRRYSSSDDSLIQEEEQLILTSSDDFDISRRYFLTNLLFFMIY